MQRERPDVLGLVAGQGQFPILVAKGARKQGWGVAAVGFPGNTHLGLEASVDWFRWLNLGQLGKLLAFFSAHRVSHVVFAGGIDKPRALDIRPDFKAAKLLWNIHNKNDNSLLSAVAGQIRKEGMHVLPPLQFVPELKMPLGQLTKRSLTKGEQRDLDYGWPLAKAIGRMDIGQCIVIHEQMVIAVEALEGTNSTLLRAGELCKGGGVALKVFKPGQEESIDQPALGLATLKTMHEAGLKALVVEADKALFFDRRDSIKFADRHRLTIVGHRDPTLLGTRSNDEA
jgi:hypothetical protein